MWLAHGIVLVIALMSCCNAQHLNVNETTTVSLTEELPTPEQQVATRRRLLIGDAGDHLEDVATLDDGIDERLTTHDVNEGDRPRNPNRRRRKRKRIQPRPVINEDDDAQHDDDLARPTDVRTPYRDRPRGDEVSPRPQRPLRLLEDGAELEGRPLRARIREDDRGRPLRPPIRGADLEISDEGIPRVEADERGLRERPRDEELDEERSHRPRLREGTPLESEERPARPRSRDGEVPRFRERPYRLNDENHRPLRRRRKNRRRPQLETPAEPPGEETLTGSNAFMPHREVSGNQDDIEDSAREDVEEDPVMLREKNRNMEEIPQKSLRKEEDNKSRAEEKTSEGVEQVSREVTAAKKPQVTSPTEQVPATKIVLGEELEFPGPRARAQDQEDVPKRPRRRRLRPRVQHKLTEEKEVTEVTTITVDEKMIDEREPLKPRENKEQPKHDDVFVAVIPTATLISAPAPIKISLSDLLRDKNISLADILKEDNKKEETEPVRRIPNSRLSKTAKSVAATKLTQLSRVNQLLQKSRNNPILIINQSIETTTLIATPLPPATTQRVIPTTQRVVSSTHRVVPTTQRVISTPRKEITTEKVRHVTSTRMPALMMQETEEIDPVKMTDKTVGRGVNNSKAAEFLKSRVRLPPSGVYFPSIKLAQGIRSTSQTTGIDQDAVPSKESNSIQKTIVKTTEQTKTVIEVTTTKPIKTTELYREVVKDVLKIPIYVLNPKYHKSFPDTLPPTETNIIPAPELDIFGSYKEVKKATEAKTEEEPELVRLNIPLQPEVEAASTEKVSSAKSAEDEIVELLTAENGSGRLSRILASRNMTLSELIEHRERGATQQRISDIFLKKGGAKPDSNAEKSKPVSTGVTTVIVTEEEKPTEDESNSADVHGAPRRVPRVFEGLQPIRAKVRTHAPDISQETYPDEDQSDVVPKSEPDVESKETYADVEIDDGYRETYGTSRKIENPGKVREINTKDSNVDLDFGGLPAGMKSIMLASSAILGLAIFVFLAIFITCKVRKQKGARRRYANRNPVVQHDVEKSRSMSPVLINTGYKDMTQERRYYLWNTIRKTLRYK